MIIPVAKIIVIILVIAALAAGGFFVLKNKQSIPIPIPGTQQPILPKATEKDFDSITTDPTLKKHLVAQTNKTSYRTKTVSPGSGLTTVNEFQLKGDLVNTREIESDGSKERKHIIIIGDTTYLKDYSDGKWWKQTVKPEETKAEKEAPEQPKDFKEEYTKPNLIFKSLGKEACGNLTCYKYEQTLPESDIKRIFWFDDKEYLLRKEQGGFGEFIVTVEYSYDSIDIKTPSPTKDVPSGKNIYDYSTPTIPISPQNPLQKSQLDLFPQLPQDTNQNSNQDSGENP